MQYFVQHDGGLLQRLWQHRVTLTYLESAMSDNLVLQECDQPGLKETYCIPLMKAGSQRNLDQKNMFEVIH